MSAAQDIAHFLATRVEPGKALRVSEIAELPDCPITPSSWGESPGDEAHCQRITRALTQAVMRGLVERTRPAGRGPWYYKAATKEPDDVALTKQLEQLQRQVDALLKLARAQAGLLVAYRTGGPTPGKHIDAARAAQERLAALGVTL